MGQSIAPLMFGSAFTNMLTASMSASSQASLNRQMMGFNARENQKNRDWQQQMYNQEKYDQMNFYNMFQSPQAVARQLSAIGVNPSSVMSQGSGIGASPASMPSFPSGSAASVSGLQNPDSYYQQAIDSTTKMIDSISNSYLREKQALNVISQTQGQEFANKIAAFNAYLTENYGENEKIQGIRNLVADVALKTANKDYTEAQTSLNEIMQKIQNKELDIKDEEYSQLLINGSFLVQQLNDMHNLNLEQQKTEKSKQSSNYASASSSYASAALSKAYEKTENALRPYRTNIERANSYVSQATSPARIKSAEQEVVRSEWFNEILKNKNLGIVLENKDKAVYNAFQRLVRGKSVDGDVIQLLKGISELGEGVQFIGSEPGVYK